MVKAPTPGFGDYLNAVVTSVFEQTKVLLFNANFIANT